MNLEVPNLTTISISSTEEKQETNLPEILLDSSLDETSDFTIPASATQVQAKATNAKKQEKEIDPNATSDLTAIFIPKKPIDEKYRYPVLTYKLDDTEHHYPLIQAETTIGRTTESVLTIPLINLSRQHCKIIKEKEGWYLEDCASVNGTFLNKRKLSKRVRLTPGATIQLGEFELKFDFLLQKPASTKEVLFSLSTFLYFIFSGFWHSLVVVVAVLLVWNAPTTLAGSKILQISLVEQKLLEERTAEENPPLFNEQIPIQEDIQEVPEEEQEEEEESLIEEEEFAPIVDQPEKIAKDPLKIPFDKFSKRIMPKKKKVKKAAASSEEDSSKPEKGKAPKGKEVVLDEVKSGDPLLSKVGQIKESILILNVSGEYDQTGSVLRDLKMKHKNLSPSSFFKLLLATPEKHLKNHQKLGLPPFLKPKKHLVIINCGSMSVSSSALNKRFKDFIGEGGFAITTDWSLDLIANVFPNYLRSSQKNLSDGNYLVSINSKMLRHPLLHAVPNVKGNFRWYIEGASSYPIVRSKQVKVLVKTQKRRFPVAVSFAYQKKLNSKNAATSYPGRVLHYVSHLHRQNTGKKGVYNLQMLFINFILVKQKEYETYQRKAQQLAQKAK